MAKKAEKKTSYEIAVGLKRGHKVTKNERKKPRPANMKGVSNPVPNARLIWHLFHLEIDANNLISHYFNDANMTMCNPR